MSSLWKQFKELFSFRYSIGGGQKVDPFPIDSETHEKLFDACELISKRWPPFEIHEWSFDETDKLLYGLDKNGKFVIVLNKKQFEALDKAAVTKQWRV